MAIAEPTILASLLAVALGLTKVIEALVTWGLKKFLNGKTNGNHTTIVQLAPDMSEMIRETHLKVSDIHTITLRVNDEGAPMVYGPRDAIHEVKSQIEDVNEKLNDAEITLASIYDKVVKKNNQES